MPDAEFMAAVSSGLYRSAEADVTGLSAQLEAVQQAIAAALEAGVLIDPAELQQAIANA
jgi:hypothetical protein